MSDSNNYPAYELLKQYVPVKDVPSYYSISEDEVLELIKDKKVRYAELKHPQTNRRVLQVNMVDVLKSLDRRVRLFHLENRKELPNE